MTAVAARAATTADEIDEALALAHELADRLARASRPPSTPAVDHEIRLSRALALEVVDVLEGLTGTATSEPAATGTKGAEGAAVPPAPDGARATVQK